MGGCWGSGRPELSSLHPYERLTVWQRAHRLAVAVYRESTDWSDPVARTQAPRAPEATAVPTDISPRPERVEHTQRSEAASNTLPVTHPSTVHGPPSQKMLSLMYFRGFF